MVLLVLPFAFTSCSKDDAESAPEEKTIVGYWKATGPLFDASGTSMYVSFQADGTYKVASKSPNTKVYMGIGTYTFDGTTVIVKIDGSTDKSTVTFVNNSQFINKGQIETTFVRVTETDWKNFTGGY